MRYLYLGLTAAALACAQTSNTSTQIPDLNGGFSTAGPSVKTVKGPNGSSGRTEYAPSINGTSAPRESVEEKVIRQGPDGRVVERYVRRFDATGNAGPLEKTVIEERKSGNTVTTTATVYRGDLNGNLATAERSVSTAVTQGAAVNTSTVIERSGLDGGLAVAERVNSSVVKKSKDLEQQTVTRMRKDASGAFYEAVREVSDKQIGPNGAVTENKAQYVGGTLAEQSVRRVSPGPGGSSVATVDVFGPQQPGMSADVSGRLALKERQTITQTTANGQTMQTVTSSKPSVSDPNRLGPAQVLSRSVCQGPCTQN